MHCSHAWKSLCFQQARHRQIYQILHQRRFQFVTCLVSHYLVYGLIVVTITFITATASASMSRQHYRRLADVARRSNEVEVERDGAVLVVPSYDLVPGDLVLISDDMDLPCDMLLVSGECLVIEAALTGESFPVVKIAIDISGEGLASAAAGSSAPATFDDASNAKSKLAAGTTVLQTRRLGGAPVKARVWATGFWSDKGRLIRAILFPRSGRMLLIQARYTGVQLNLNFSVGSQREVEWEFEEPARLW